MNDTLSLDYQRRRSIHGILASISSSSDYVSIVYSVYELIRVMEDMDIIIKINEFMLLLKDNIYKDIKFIYYDSFKSNKMASSHNAHLDKSHTIYCTYYLHFLNYADYYYSQLYKTPENSIDKKILSYESSRSIKKQIELFIDVLDKESISSI